MNTMATLGGWLFTIIVGLIFVVVALLMAGCVLFVVLRLIGEARADARRSREIEASRRTEVIDGKIYSVVTERHSLVREKRTGRVGIVLARGNENDPHTVNGELQFQPRWVQVQFIRKSDGKPGAVQWRQFAHFEVTGTAAIDRLTRRTGMLSTEQLLRFPKIV